MINSDEIIPILKTVAELRKIPLLNIKDEKDEDFIIFYSLGLITGMSLKEKHRDFLIEILDKGLQELKEKRENS